MRIALPALLLLAVSPAAAQNIPPDAGNEVVRTLSSDTFVVCTTTTGVEEKTLEHTEFRAVRDKSRADVR